MLRGVVQNLIQAAIGPFDLLQQGLAWTTCTRKSLSIRCGDAQHFEKLLDDHISQVDASNSKEVPFTSWC